MRLNKYINEMEKYDDEYIAKRVIFPMLLKKCKPFLIEFLKWQRSDGFKWFWRGTNKQYTEIGEVPRRKNRKPLDTPEETQRLLDLRFHKKFGWAVRSEGVFATSSHSMSTGYGMYQYAFFPFGKYRYVWSEKVRDLYSDLHLQGLIPSKADKLYAKVTGDKEVLYPTSKEKYLIALDDFNKWKKDPKGWKAEVEKRLDWIVDEYTDKNMSGALHSGREIAFDCNKFYLVESQYLYHLSDKLQNL